MEYNFKEIEARWQKYWSENHTYRAENQSDRPKYYVLDMFPYPSGKGLHVGHPLGYIASDIYSRYKRMKGFNVLHPMGYDAFGLPAEQYAVETGQHPAVTTEANIKRYREQLDRIGFSFDWSREVRTSDPKFYRWTQWIFMQLFQSWYNQEADRAESIDTLVQHLQARGTENLKAATDSEKQFSASEWAAMSEKEQQHIFLDYRLAFLSETLVNWCPALGTVLANEEVKDGLSERGNYPVVRKQMQQWSLRITAYADRLLQGLETIDWPDPLKEIQRNWIGRSEGASIHFGVKNHDHSIEIFTTRPDTIFGATFMVLAPEHELVNTITTDAQRAEVEAYVDFAAKRSEKDRMADVKSVTGAFTGAFAMNPITGEPVPIWISDYVLISYGTGAIMAVPSGDQRDWNFARHFELPIVPVIEGQDVSEGADERKDGVLINSGFLDGKMVKEAIAAILDKIETDNLGQRKVNFRIRDAIFSRQRYWGEPFPVYFKDGVPVLMKEDQLPLELPEVDKFQPTEDGDPPLARSASWKTEDGDPIEASTMPGWAGSSWYYLRYMDPENDNAIIDPKVADYWGQVDLYMGGAEHATGHLLYIRFWTKFLKDRGFLNIEEPAQKLINQGMILAEDGQKMSKRYNNVVNPDDICEAYGADTLRLHEMFLGPIEQSKPWNTKGIEGVHRFLRKLWRLFVQDGQLVISEEAANDKELKALHQAIKRITEDVERFSFNTPVSHFMVCVNELTDLKCNKRAILEPLVLLLAPYAPHIAEELWRQMGHSESLTHEAYPMLEVKYLIENSISYPVSFNGKMRFKIELPADMGKDDIEKAVLADENAARWLDGKTPRKVIVVPKRIVNVVV
ncbi:MAG: leucine--tRNA ligase [Salibacteraceae bacterium]